MDEDFDELVVRIRADTSQFRREMGSVRDELNGPLVSGVEQAGTAIEHGLLRAVRRGKLGFDDLRKVALSAMADIAAASLRAVVPGGSSGAGNFLTGLLSGALGLPGRATGGPVSEARPYLVGERGPEIFVPQGAGRIEPISGGAQAVNVRVALQAPPRERDAAVLSRSTRQVGRAVRRALMEAGR